MDHGFFVMIFYFNLKCMEIITEVIMKRKLVVLNWKCKKCKQIGGFRHPSTSDTEVNRHSPTCKKCGASNPWVHNKIYIMVKSHSKFYFDSPMLNSGSYYPADSWEDYNN